MYIVIHIIANLIKYFFYSSPSNSDSSQFWNSDCCVPNSIYTILNFTRDRILCLNYIYIYFSLNFEERERELISITVYVSYYTKLRFNSLPQRIHLSFKLKSDNVSFKVVTNRAHKGFREPSWNSNWNLQQENGVAVEPCSMN